MVVIVGSQGGDASRWLERKFAKAPRFRPLYRLVAYGEVPEEAHGYCLSGQYLRSSPMTMRSLSTFQED